jgi:hypothetical protein
MQKRKNLKGLRERKKLKNEVPEVGMKATKESRRNPGTLDLEIWSK